MPPLIAKKLLKSRKRGGIKEKKGGKEGKNREKENKSGKRGKIGKERQKSGRFFHFTPPDREGWLRHCSKMHIFRATRIGGPGL